MLERPKTHAEAEKRKYGTRGQTAYDPSRCAYEVMEHDNGWPRSHQCYRKPQYGPDNLYCKIHTPEYIAARKAKREAKGEAEHQAFLHKLATASDKNKAITILAEVAKWIAANKELVDTDEWLATIASDIAGNTTVMEHVE